MLHAGIRGTKEGQQRGDVGRQAVASTLVGAARLQRSVMGASNAADGTGDYDLFSALTERIRV